MRRVLRDASRAILRAYWATKRGLHLGQGVKFNGLPIIDIRNGASIHIGDDVVINSINRGYHANMFGPVKLFADRPGATITIGEGSRLHGACLHAVESISIGKRCLIAANCQIIDGNGHDLSFPQVHRRGDTTGGSRPIEIEDDVWIGLGVTILPGVTIGRGSVIGAGSVVTRDVPPMVVASGNPATVSKVSHTQHLKAAMVSSAGR
jgi:acetyltransferase-like isoleucine patch superfamily enzyme